MLTKATSKSTKVAIKAIHISTTKLTNCHEIEELWALNASMQDFESSSMITFSKFAWKLVVMTIGWPWL